MIMIVKDMCCQVIDVYPHVHPKALRTCMPTSLFMPLFHHGEINSTDLKGHDQNK